MELAQSKTGARRTKLSKQEKPPKGKASQLGLFSGELPVGRKQSRKTLKAGKAHKPRGKK
jgi:hypothetical protein